MATVVNSDIPILRVGFHERADLRATKLAKPGASFQAKGRPDDAIGITVYQPSFRAITGSKPTYSLLISSLSASQNPFFHGTCVYIPDQNEIYATSRPLASTDASRLPVVLISRVKLALNEAGDVASAEWMKLRPPPSMPMPAGAARYVQTRSAPAEGAAAATEEGILFCAQGSTGSATAGLFFMPLGQPPSPVVTGYYGRELNSPRHTAVSPATGRVWFTDPCSGFDDDFRPRPLLPCQVYCLDVGDGVERPLRAVADGFERPTAVALDPAEDVLYVTDVPTSDASEGGPPHPASIYAFDIVERGGAPFLCNRRLFACPVKGQPLDVKCDPGGNVWAGCGDGLEVWRPDGTLLGVVEVPGGASAFCFGTRNDVFICSEQRLWRVRFAPETAGQFGP